MGENRIISTWSGLLIRFQSNVMYAKKKKEKEHLNRHFEANITYIID